MINILLFNNNNRKRKENVVLLEINLILYYFRGENETILTSNKKLNVLLFYKNKILICEISYRILADDDVEYSIAFYLIKSPSWVI